MTVIRIKGSEAFCKKIAGMKNGKQRVIAADVAGNDVGAAVKKDAEASGRRSLMKDDGILLVVNDFAAEKIDRTQNVLLTDAEKERRTGDLR